MGNVLLLGESAERVGSGVLVHGELSGQRVLVRRLTVDGDARSRAHAALLARELPGRDHPNLLRVVDVRTDWSGIDLVSESPGAAASLTGLLARRSLTPAEVVGLGQAVGQALASLHEAGQTHGRLTAADLLVGLDGSVLVTGFGVAGVLGSPGSPSADVRDLLDLLLACLGDATTFGSEQLRQVLGELDGSPDLDVVTLQDALGGLPVSPVGVAHRPSEPLHRRRHRVRPGTVLRRLPRPRLGWRVLGAVLPAALGVLLLAGWLGASLPSAAGESMTGQPGVSGAPSPAAPAPTGRPPRSVSPSPPVGNDWRAVLTALNDGRSRLFAEPDERALASVDAPGSSAYAADLALVRDLVHARAAGRGLRTDVVSVRVRSAGPTRADLTVVDVLRPYTVVRTVGADAGQVLQQRVGRPARTTLVVLVRVAGQWRVAEVRAA